MMTIRLYHALSFVAIVLLAGSLVLALPAASPAAPPSAVTLHTVSTGPTTAAVNGEINPEGEDASFDVLYDVASSTWCSSGGASGSPAHTVPGYDVGFDSEFHPVSLDLTGLTEGADYCAHILALNGAPGSADGGQVEWTQGAATADTSDAVSVGSADVQVDGDVDQAGQTTTYSLAYDLVSSVWCSSGGTSGSPANVTTATSVGLPDPADGTLHDVTVDLSGLTDGSSYCAQLSATNADGSASGGQIEWMQGLPTADTFGGFSTAGSTATVEGDVNPAGQSTSYFVKYDLASSEWCTTAGASGVPANATAPQILPATDGTFHGVSINVTGLTPLAGYCAEVVASNTTGSTPIDDGDQASWTQLPPTPQYTLSVSTVGFGPEVGSGTVTSSPAGIDCGAAATACSMNVTAGTQVTLTASPAPANAFGGWLGFPCSSSAGSASSCILTVNADTKVTAGFNKLPTNLVVQANGPGSGTVTSSPTGIPSPLDCTVGGGTCQTELFGLTQVAVTATPASGSIVSGWSGGGCSGVSSTCVATLNPSADPKLDVTFIIVTFSPKPSPGPPHTTTCVVPKVKGKPLTAAKKAIKSHHCSVGKITKVESTKKNRDHVVSQNPKPGKHLGKGAKVALKVGK